MSGNMTTAELLASFGLAERRSSYEAVADALRDARCLTATQATERSGFSRKGVNDALLKLVNEGKAVVGFPNGGRRTPHYVWVGK